MDDRTEGAALRGVLTLTLGGEPVTLRTLTLDESDVWLGLYADALEHVDLSPAAVGSAFTAPAALMVDLVLAYDLEGTIPHGIRQKATKLELKTALEAMVAAEDPFGEDVARSVAAGFGAPSRLLTRGLASLLNEDTLLLLASLTAGQGANGASATPTSDGRGAASSSSSAGTTRRTTKRTA